MKFSNLLLTMALASFTSPTTNAFSSPSTSTINRIHHPNSASTILFSTATETATAAPAIVEERESDDGRPLLVDMNKYNLPLDKVAEEWTANIVAANSMIEEGIYLGAKDKRTNFVDTEKSQPIPRKIGQGLGIELLEIAGGREDGLGITVVNGLVDGGVSEKKGILPGDSIVKISIFDDNTKNELASISTECLGYDATVEAIGNLPSPQSDNEYMIITVKRLRRKPKVTLNLQYPPEQGEENTTIELFSGENLRRAMLVRGVKLNDPLSKRFDSGGSGDCGAEGTCATCAVSILEGQELLNKPGLTEAGMLKKNPRWRMACRAIVGYGMQEGTMTVRVNPRQWNDN